MDDEVYQSIQQVLAKGRKSSQSKAETKTVIDELAARVEQAHATGVVDGRPMEGLKKPPSVRAKPAAKKGARGQKAKARAKRSDDEEEELLSLSEDDDDTPPARVAPTTDKVSSRSAPARRAATKAKAKAAVKDDSSSAEEAEAEERGAGGALDEEGEKKPTAPKRRVVSDDDGSAGETSEKPAPKATKAKAGGAKRKAKAKAAAKDSDSEADAAEPMKAKKDGSDEESAEVVRKPAARKGRKQIVDDEDLDN